MCPDWIEFRAVKKKILITLVAMNCEILNSSKLPFQTPPQILSFKNKDGVIPKDCTFRCPRI